MDPVDVGNDGDVDGISGSTFSTTKAYPAFSPPATNTPQILVLPYSKEWAA